MLQVEAGFAEGATLPPPPGLAIEHEGQPSTRLVLSFPLPGSRPPTAQLTAAEQAVAEGLLLGLTNLEIAASRGVSQHTVANQVAAIFVKLNVSSRLTLALCLRDTTLW